MISPSSVKPYPFAAKPRALFAISNLPAVTTDTPNSFRVSATCPATFTKAAPIATTIPSIPNGDFDNNENDLAACLAPSAILKTPGKVSIIISLPLALALSWSRVLLTWSLVTPSRNLPSSVISWLTFARSSVIPNTLLTEPKCFSPACAACSSKLITSLRSSAWSLYGLPRLAAIFFPCYFLKSCYVWITSL